MVSGGGQSPRPWRRSPGGIFVRRGELTPARERAPQAAGGAAQPSGVSGPIRFRRLEEGEPLAKTGASEAMPLVPVKPFDKAA